MVIKLLLIICIMRECVRSHIDFCSLPCKNPFTAAITRNSACVCKLGTNCGTSAEILAPTMEDKNYIVDIHNAFREKVASGNETRGRNTAASNMAALVYDDHIQLVAQCHANKCVPSGDECRRTENFHMVGQNFYLSYGQELCQTKGIFKEAIETWYEEVFKTYKICLRHYMGCASQYTQVVWAETTNVGCGRILFDKTCHIFCNYGPAGNIEGHPVYLPGKANCTKYDEKYKNLCQRFRKLKSSRQSVQYAMDQFAMNGSHVVRIRTGRKWTTTDCDDRQILRESLKNSRKISSVLIAEWSESINKTRSDRIIRRRLQEIGLKGYNTRKKPWCSDRNKKAQYEWAKYQSFTEQDWSNIVWSNKTYVNSVDYCALKCEKPGGGLVENTACKCKVDKSACGGDPNILPPDEETKKFIVQVHNDLRQQLASGKTSLPGASNMIALTYSDALEHVAACWNKRCKFAHDECRRTEKFKVAGQNLFLSTYPNCEGKDTFKKASTDWFNEIKDAPLSCIRKYSGCSGHFTQMVWAETTHIGCARIKYSGKCQIACNYGPAGNIRTLPVYKEGSPTCEREPNFSHLCKSEEREYGGRGSLVLVPPKTRCASSVLNLLYDTRDFPNPCKHSEGACLSRFRVYRDKSVTSLLKKIIKVIETSSIRNFQQDTEPENRKAASNDGRETLKAILIRS
ncbi:PI15 [Trypoxylus dichotomus]